jgi:hypothetical protein
VGFRLTFSRFSVIFRQKGAFFDAGTREMNSFSLYEKREILSEFCKKDLETRQNTLS